MLAYHRNRGTSPEALLDGATCRDHGLRTALLAARHQMEKTPLSSVEAFWTEFAEATGVEAPYEAWAFGGDDMPDLATELALLVRDGPKRATASLVSSYDKDGELFPTVGVYSVILDGDGSPVCIIQTTSVEVSHFGDVDEQFAWDEGEGDRTLADWRRSHIWFFEADGTPVTDDDLVVLERFGESLAQIVAAT